MSGTEWVSKAGFPECPARASEAAVKLIGDHLGLSERSKGEARLVMIGYEDASLLWFVFADDRGGEAWLGIAPAGGEAWAFNGRTLKVCCRVLGSGAGEVSGLHQLALQRLGARLDGVPFSRLIRLARPPAPSGERKDSLASGDGGPLPPAQPSPAPEKQEGPLSREAQRRRLHSTDWAHPDGWREFCCFSVIEWCPGQTFLGNCSMSGESCAIRYGDLECQSSHAFMGGAVQTPWDFDRNQAGESSGGVWLREYLALVDDQDVIHGTGVSKVEAILDALAEDPSGGSVQFYNSCISMMAGDDVRGPLARFGERTGRKVVFSDMSPWDCHHESLSRRIRRELESVRSSRPSGGGGEGSFNLVGFRPTVGREELVSLLAEAGARLNLIVLPTVELQSLVRYPDAAVQVMMPNRYYEEIYAELESQPLPALKGLAPFGKEGSLRWLRELAGMLGGEVPARLEALLADRVRDFDPKWGSLVERAGAYRAGFVVGPGDALRLEDPVWTGGVHVPGMLHEMGFGIDFLSFRKGDEAPDPDLARLVASLPGAGASRHGVLPFRDRDELTGHLAAGRLAIVFSNVRHDTRLTRNGVMRFSLNDLEMGLDGALRTAERLLARCEVPFFRENASRLRSAA